jgi:hypothetical protein
LAARIETVQAVLMMTASQAETLLGCAEQIQGAYHKMAERLQSAPHPEAVFSLQARLDSLQSELDWLETRYPISGSNADIAALQARLAKDQAKLLRLRSEAAQEFKIAGQIASLRVEVGRLTSHAAAISKVKQRSEALLATVKSLSG